ncbi:hypothetical protein KIPB_000464 [Kipferlia bialata]|uniref:IQ motif, EF-hand binding site n=1 Tax=Kipferlia bialata TaxID=797122 RepID=A0A9K3GDH6_9EUKA|nr:hypothetical protein KIPB_000464 [Kipferlia bialata]|eukprot:g464.t1
MAALLAAQDEVNEQFMELAADVHSLIDVFQRHNVERIIFAQSWIRGFITRSKANKTRAAATTIQKHWRAFCVRRQFLVLREVYRHQYNMRAYDEAALKIQTTWRGWYVRRHLCDVAARGRYLLAVAAKTAEFSELMRRTEAEEEAARKEREKVASEEELGRMTQHLHHLLSTETRSGILKPPFPERAPTLGGKNVETVIRTTARARRMRAPRTRQRAPKSTPLEPLPGTASRPEAQAPAEGEGERPEVEDNDTDEWAASQTDLSRPTIGDLSGL